MAALIENMNYKKDEGVLQHADLEAIERVIYKNGDDVAVSIARSFERIEEKIDAVESRIYSRLTDLEDDLLAELKTLRLLVEGGSEGVIGEK